MDFIEARCRVELQVCEKTLIQQVEAIDNIANHFITLDSRACSTRGVDRGLYFHKEFLHQNNQLFASGPQLGLECLDMDRAEWRQEFFKESPRLLGCGESSAELMMKQWN